MKTRREFWSGITSDQFILDTVSYGLRTPFLDCPSSCAPSTWSPMSPVQKEILSTEVNALLRRGIIIRREHELGEFISPVFITSKQDGSHRFILNLKQFNLCVQHDEAWDMDGQKDQKFFSFAWGENYYRFLCLPNGYKDGPRAQLLPK